MTPPGAVFHWWPDSRSPSGWVSFLGKITSQAADDICCAQRLTMWLPVPWSTWIYYEIKITETFQVWCCSWNQVEIATVSSFRLNSPKWLHFSCGVFRTFQWKDVKFRVFSFSANSGLWVYEILWMVAKSESPVVRGFIPLFVGVWPSFWWLVPRVRSSAVTIQKCAIFWMGFHQASQMKQACSSHQNSWSPHEKTDNMIWRHNTQSISMGFYSISTDNTIDTWMNIIYMIWYVSMGFSAIYPKYGRSIDCPVRLAVEQRGSIRTSSRTT